MELALRSEDTIFALATGPARSAIAMIRVSGSATKKFLQRTAPGPALTPRRASLRDIIDPQTGEILDEAIVIFFPDGSSYTGEDSAELHIHGGRSVVRDVLAMLVEFGLRPAERGEFTLRAMISGRLDLAQAEAVHDLVASDTTEQRRQALRQRKGESSEQYKGWAEELTGILSRVEARIDFSGEELPLGPTSQERTRIGRLRATLNRVCNTGRCGERLREGLKVALVGRPNVGKSSLLNALSRREAAITSPLPGTTRDIVPVLLELDGWPVELMDMAGMRETCIPMDPVEQEGIARAREMAQSADLLLCIEEADRWLDQGGALFEEWRDIFSQPCLFVLNKADRVASGDFGKIPHLLVSALAGTGIKELEQVLTDQARELMGGGEGVLVTRRRHVFHLSECVGELDDAASEEAPEMMAHHLWRALRALGRITGRVDIEEVLDEIFAEFCIGK